INNAVKFTPTGGTIEIRTRNDSNHQINVEIQDSGLGIEPELQPVIFNAFEQGGPAVTSKFGGLGLGLAVSKRIIDLHQGSISVQSAGRNQGSTFKVALRAMATSLLGGPVYFLEQTAPTTSPARILLVEDHGDTAHALLRLLEGNG